jgi:hypothetical protein
MARTSGVGYATSLISVRSDARGYAVYQMAPQMTANDVMQSLALYRPATRRNGLIGNESRPAGSVSPR